MFRVRRHARAPIGGFSLTEVLVAGGLLAVLVLAAAPRLWVPEPLQAGVAARGVAADLRLAQRLAIVRRTDVMLEFAPAVPPYQSYVVHEATGGAEPDFRRRWPVSPSAARCSSRSCPTVPFNREA